MDTVTDIIARVRRKRIRLWVEEGRLRYHAPNGALTHEDLENLRANERYLVALLDRVATGEAEEPRVVPRVRRDRAPLAFSQLAHWNLYRLNEHRTGRHLAAASRLRGRLNVLALERSISEVVRRHDALRTNIVVIDGVPTQTVSETRHLPFEVKDLTTLPSNLRENEVQRAIERQQIETIDVGVDSLFVVQLLRLHEQEHVLLVAMEHVISDGGSLSILLREVFTAYAQAVRGIPFSLPEVSLQFSDYAAWQRSTHFCSIEKRISYWHERMASCNRIVFPEDKTLRRDGRRGLGAVRFQIDRDLQLELREWCRTRQTTLVMGAYTAYVALVLRWCGAPEGVLRCQTDGRFSRMLDNTIGYVAFPLYMRLELLAADTFVDLLNRVTEEYCRAHEHADFSYLEAQVPKPDFTRNARFNWRTQDQRSGYWGFDQWDDAVSWTPVPSEMRAIQDLPIDDDPSLGLWETDGEIHASLVFPLHRFSFEMMERFARNFVVFVKTLLRKPEGRISNVALE